MKYAVANNRGVNLESYDTRTMAQRRVDIENEYCKRNGLDRRVFYFIKQVGDDYVPYIGEIK